MSLYRVLIANQPIKINDTDHQPEGYNPSTGFSLHISKYSHPSYSATDYHQIELTESELDCILKDSEDL
ncbi:MAG: hypothetical protein ACHBN1_13920 [Heteroscytonema crispum UTEX LB 1556]